MATFLKTTLGSNGNWVSMVYLIFGFAAVAGGGLGGTASDPYTTFSFLLFIIVMIIWSMISWGITPAQQSVRALSSLEKRAG
ncbi:hypothetical protein [Guptibacillus hwajinpoensis]|uniref:hypothetical protein n=1 Tax=Guptibacillus hwajinpoensis TaxID=208199 RepID=UPI003D6C219B